MNIYGRQVRSSWEHFHVLPKGMVNYDSFLEHVEVLPYSWLGAINVNSSFHITSVPTSTV